MECKSNGAVGGCYMYSPVCPVILAPNEGETRPIGGGPMFGGRAHGVGLATEEMQISLAKNTKGFIFYWAPKQKDNVMAAKKKVAEEVKPVAKTAGKKSAKKAEVKPVEVKATKTKKGK